ncbi:Increased DNA methylation 1, partial [Mucuna pruriens]
MRESLRSQVRVRNLESGERGVQERRNENVSGNEEASSTHMRRKTTESICEMIVTQLTAAGWTTCFKVGKQSYKDAIYLSPDEKIHWSIILAYNRLKHHYEAGDGKAKVYTSGFHLTPVPEEDIKILTEEMEKEKRSPPEEVLHMVTNVGSSANRVNEEVDFGATTSKGREQQSTGKRTVLSWMIDMGTIQPRQKVYHTNPKGKRPVMSGEIVGGEILCWCCFQVMSISDFEAHCSSTTLSNPLKNICVEGGPSLLQYLAHTWNKEDELGSKFYHFVRVPGDDKNDYVCNHCREGGDLICCDSCPSAFHQRCLDIQTLPSGDWHCMYCRCKFCGLYGKQSDGFGNSMRSACHHQSCLKASGANITPSEQSFFCGNGCKVIYEGLEKLLGVKHVTEDGFSWCFICRSDVGSNTSQIEPLMVECNAKLGVALSIMHEGFMPCIDHSSGVDLIRSVLYNCGSNFSRLDCKRFVTAILERNDEIISVASIRIHGNQLAEMPYVATGSMYRRQGMFSRLLKAIESVLRNLNVELLVIPAVSEIKATWISAFGFEPLDLRSKTMIKGFNLLVFPGIEMLQKKIAKRNLIDENFIPTT